MTLHWYFVDFDHIIDHYYGLKRFNRKNMDIYLTNEVKKRSFEKTKRKLILTINIPPAIRPDFWQVCLLSTLHN